MGPIDAIVAKLQKELLTDAVEIYDFSDAHSGHAQLNAQAINLHLKGNITSSKFNGLSRVNKERLVNSILADELNSGVIHAMSFNLLEKV